MCFIYQAWVFESLWKDRNVWSLKTSTTKATKVLSCVHESDDEIFPKFHKDFGANEMGLEMAKFSEGPCSSGSGRGKSTPTLKPPLYPFINK